MTLSDILGRGVQLDWHEAVAVVRELIERGDGMESNSIPEFHHVELLPSGQIELHGEVTVDDPVEWLAQMLQTLISPQKPPPQFSELLATQPLDSLEAFSQSLAYFERPNRVAILQDLYSRASGSSPLPNADELIASLRATALSAPPDGEPEAAGASPHRKLLYAAGILGFIGAAAIAATLWWRPGAASAIGSASLDLTAKVSQGVTGVAGAVGSAVSSIGERAGLSSPSPQPAAAPVDAQPPAPTPGPARGPRGPSGQGSARSGASPVPAAAPEALDPPAVARDQVSPGDNVAAAPYVLPDERASLVSVPADLFVYSASSPDVAPPVPVRPQLPRELPEGFRPDSAARIEIVVLADGNVGSVKLLTTPRTIHDSMLLSAVKAWQFRPATKDGKPVIYRSTIWVVR